MKIGRKTDWTKKISSQQSLIRSVKNKDKMREYLNDLPDDEHVRDDRNGNHLLISETKDSTLRRIKKKLENFYYLLDDGGSKTMIRNKMEDITKVLTDRDNTGTNILK